MKSKTTRNSREARRSVRNRERNQQSFFSNDEDVNPMEYLSNLSDVMLILAVGIMLALILHWNVEINDTSAEVTETQNQESVTFSDDDLESTEEMPEDAEAMGTVYYDSETGKYYYRIDN